MQELGKRLATLETDFLGVYEKLKIDEKLEQIARHEKGITIKLAPI